MHSQNNEEEIILKYFGDFVGSLLDIGANDGITLSNSRALMERGWRGVLIEPAPTAFAKLQRLYGRDNPSTYLRNVAITEAGSIPSEIILYESGSHLGKGDTALLSSLDEEETLRWKKETFTPVKVTGIPYDMQGYQFDFITIDAEGMDWEILQQIDLSETQMLCIEWNQHDKLKQKYTDYCLRYGLKFHYQTYENLIFAR
jgi:FkbM family methyltransferase